MQTRSEDRQDFYQACKTGNLEKVNHYLNLEGFDPAYRGNWGLKFSVMHQHLKIVNRLIEFPDVVEKLTDDNNYVLRNVLKSGNLAILDCLLELPILVEQVKMNGSMLVLDAIDGKNLEGAKRLLIIDPNLAKKKVLCSAEDFFIIEKVRNEIQTDRKNMLMLFRANIMEEGSVSKFSPEILFKIASYIPSLRLHNMEQKAFEDRLHHGWQLVQRKTRRHSI